MKIGVPISESGYLKDFDMDATTSTDGSGFRLIVDCKSSSDFLNKISPLRSAHTTDHAYRGLPTTEYALTPTLFRSPIPTQIPDVVSLAAFSSAPPQWCHELELLRQFYWRLNRAGLAIPDDSASLRTLFEKDSRRSITEIVDNDGFWPPREVDGLMALAQHNTLPTRLLDWTWSPFVAAFFACVIPVKTIANPFEPLPAEQKKLCVWCLDTSALKNLNALRSSNRVETVTVAAATNPLVHAQSAFFTTIRSSIQSYDEAFEQKALDQQLQELMPGRSPPEGWSSVDYPLTCFTLPQLHAPQLAHDLTKLGISYATIYPGYDGVAKSIFLEDLIEKALKRGHDDARIATV